VSKTVFILGAGASAAAGAPMMRNFLDQAERLLATSRIQDGDAADFKLVFEGIAELDSIYARSSLDTDNLEAVFVTFEMAALLGKLGDWSEDKIKRLPSAMRRLIVRTLEEMVVFPGGPREDPQANPEYNTFAAFVKDVCDRRGDAVSIITFNYDCALDFALTRWDVQVDYCINGASAARIQSVDVLKLHGSLNWSSENSPGGSSSAIRVDEIVVGSPFFTRPVFGLNDGYRLRLSRAPGYSEPVIVPPTWDKAKDRGLMRPVWRAAARHLFEAENIIICGFSLPATDEFFRYLFALGTVGPTRMKNVVVCDPFADQGLHARYRQLLGPKAANRYTMVRRTFGEVCHYFMAHRPDIEGSIEMMRSSGSVVS
jgi:hypothetical protein